MIKKFAIAATTAWFCLATPLVAGVSSDFSGCDGLKKPKSKDDGMRDIAKERVFGRDSADQTIASCNRALERKQLRPEQNLRRAHLLRARAAARLQKEEFDSALQDLDAAEAELATYRGEFFFDRSMGVSMDLLRSIALSGKGKAEDALILAKKASESRPYAVQVQLASTIIRDRHEPKDVDRKEVWSRLAKIVPESRNAARIRSSADGDDAESFQAIIAENGDAALTLPVAPGMDLFNGTPMDETLANWANHYSKGYNLAYALAAQGEVEASKERLAEVQAAIDKAIVSDGDKPATMWPAAMKLLDARLFSSRENLVNARIALEEGRIAEVDKIISGQSYDENLFSRELYAAFDLANEASEIEVPPLPPLRPARLNSGPELSGLASSLLIRPEEERKLIDYQRERPDVVNGVIAGALTLGFSLLQGVAKTQGFKSEEREDGAVVVQFNGRTTIGSVVQEMTILRAAELTIEAGKSHFFIEGRKDYGVYLSNYVERQLTGYRSSLRIRYYDRDQAPASSIEALKVIDTLGPTYYEK